MLCSSSKETSRVDAQALRFPDASSRNSPSRCRALTGISSFDKRETERPPLQPPSRIEALAVSVKARFRLPSSNSHETNSPVPIDDQAQLQYSRTLSQKPADTLKIVLGSNRIIPRPVLTGQLPRASLPKYVRTSSDSGVVLRVCNGAFARGGSGLGTNGSGVNQKSIDTHLPLQFGEGSGDRDAIKDSEEGCRQTRPGSQRRTNAMSATSVQDDQESDAATTFSAMQAVWDERTHRQEMGELTAEVEGFARTRRA